MTALDRNHGQATADWLDRYHAAVAPVLPSYFELVADHAEGSWVTDVEGRRYLDLGCGIGVTNVGHRHPRVQAAVAAQLDRFWHTSVVMRHQGYIEVAERIGALCPFFAQPRTFLCNTGAEAVDGAIKLARHVTGRPGIVAFRQAFHGRTLGATSLTTAKGSYRAGYEPLLPSVHVAPYCLPGAAGSGLPEAEACEAALAELDRILDLQAPPAGVAAMVVEPVLGEGGYVVPPVAWLAGLRERCDEHGILLVVRRGPVRHGTDRPPVRGRDLRGEPRRGALRQGRGVRPPARRHRGAGGGGAATGFWILPVPPLGSSSRKRDLPGRLEAGEPVPHPVDQLGLGASRPGRSATQARGTSPHRSSGIPTTATSSTAGWAASTCSTSTEEMFSPPETMRSFLRSTMVR
jgi:hypothetical protein